MNQIRKYVLTIPSAPGTIAFGFNENDMLVYYFNESEMSDKQLKWMFDHMPLTPDILRQMQRVTKGKLEEIPIDISFQAFYGPYPNHRNKHRAEPLYNKLSEAYKTKAVMSVPAYVRYLKRSGIPPMLPENYIKRLEFLNNWDSLQQ